MWETIGKFIFTVTKWSMLPRSAVQDIQYTRKSLHPKKTGVVASFRHYLLNGKF